jgi:hypothetical protein
MGPRGSGIRGRVQLAAGILPLCFACHETRRVAPPPDPEPEDASGVLVVRGPDSPAWAWATNLENGRLPPIPPLVAQGPVEAVWSTFTCPLEDFGLRPGGVSLRPEASGRVRVPPPRIRVRSGPGEPIFGSEPTDDEDLRRLPVDREDQCGAMASRVESRLASLRGGDPFDEIRRVDAVRLDDTQALVFRYRLKEAQDPDPERDRQVFTSTNAQIHLLNLDGPAAPPSTRLPLLEAVPHVGVARFDEDRVLMAGEGILVAVRFPSGQFDRAWFHPALERAQQIRIFVESAELLSPKGWILTDTEPTLFTPDPDDSVRTLLRWDGWLRTVRTATVPFGSPGIRFFPVDDGILVRGLRSDPDRVDRIDPEGRLVESPEDLPSGPGRDPEIIQAFGDTFLLVSGANPWLRTENGDWEMLDQGWGAQLQPFRSPSASTELAGLRWISARNGEGTGVVVEQVPGVGNCAVAEHPVASWADGVTFRERRTWALLPATGIATGERTTVYLFEVMAAGPRCTP